MMGTAATERTGAGTAFGLLLSPILAGAAMAFSSVTVVTNANRLRLYQPKGA